jgi:hypothetical protein
MVFTTHIHTQAIKRTTPNQPIAIVTYNQPIPTPIQQLSTIPIRTQTKPDHGVPITTTKEIVTGITTITTTTIVIGKMGTKFATK